LMLTIIAGVARVVEQIEQSNNQEQRRDGRDRD
jgi:hypothetical protein